MLAQKPGRAVLRMANADILPFDFTHLYNTINGYADELTKFLNDSRESTAIENKMIQSGDYKVGEDPTKKLIAPEAKSAVPYLDFSPLQNLQDGLLRRMDIEQQLLKEMD